MTVVTTLPNLITEPQTRYATGNFEPQCLDDIEELDPGIAWYRNWARECDEWQKQQGLTEEDMPTMEEIVAIIKEVRAERYAEEQERKGATGS